MNFYKKIIRSKKLRFKILAVLRFIPDKTMIKLQYRIKTGRKLNLNNPQRYSEKLQWYKLYYRDPVMPQCADKYQVREFVKDRGLEHILNKLYATFDSPDAISFEKLPDKFVLKLSNGSGTNILCLNKNELDLEVVKKEFRAFYSQSGASAGREWVYHTDREPIIVAEQYLEDPNQTNGIYDYKFICFEGIPYYVVQDISRFKEHRRNIYDMNWHDLHITSDCPCSIESYSRPENLDEMAEIAKILSKGFPAVRVDLYSVRGKIYFGEMTFFPWSGYVIYDPDEFDLEVGKKFILPEKTNAQSKKIINNKR